MPSDLYPASLIVHADILSAQRLIIYPLATDI